jgi:DNA-binding NtrC family response regulator
MPERLSAGHSPAKSSGLNEAPNHDAQPAASNPAIAQTIIAADPVTQHLIHQAHKVAKTRATVLIQGESGSGKDQLAQFIHFSGPAADQPYVKIDCAALPAELVESELFGYERGAFTGAGTQKRGRIELAEGGTLVLDEIAALSLSSQAKLLRVLEDRKYQRLGGTQDVEVHSRILALTNVNLEEAVAQKSFREDLFFRLNVVPLHVPPLRERRADILPLAEHLLRQLSEMHRRQRRKLSKPAAKALEAYSFPGNVRELRNLLERAVIHAASETIELRDLPEHLQRSSANRDGKSTLEDVEREYIAEILDHTRGKKSQAAQILGISRKTLLEKRKKYKLL